MHEGTSGTSFSFTAHLSVPILNAYHQHAAPTSTATLDTWSLFKGLRPTLPKASTSLLHIRRQPADLVIVFKCSLADSIFQSTWIFFPGAFKTRPTWACSLGGLTQVQDSATPASLSLMGCPSVEHSTHGANLGGFHSTIQAAALKEVCHYFPKYYLN